MYSKLFLNSFHFRQTLGIFYDNYMVKLYIVGKNYDEAINYYSQAIDLKPDVATYYGNRSFAYLRTECFGYALSDATKALELDITYVKAYYRRASANMALGKFKLALKDFEAVNNT